MILLPAELADLLGQWQDSTRLAAAGWLQIEGAEAVRWLLQSQVTISAVVGKASTLTSLQPQITALSKEQPQRIHTLSKGALAEALGFAFDRGVVALARAPAIPSIEAWYPILSRRAAWSLVIADGIHDPSNMGAIIRSARCLGCSGLMVGPGCAQPLTRRSIRSGVGHPLLLPWAASSDLAASIAALRRLGACVIAAHRGPQSQPLSALGPLPPRWAVVLGNEDRGPQAATVAACDRQCHISMANGSDSLNVAAAGCVMIHHCHSLSPDSLHGAQALAECAPGLCPPPLPHSLSP